jgi:hypothetical protein
VDECDGELEYEGRFDCVFDDEGRIFGVSDGVRVSVSNGVSVLEGVGLIVRELELV